MHLLGPVFRYDLIRVARRQRPALWRGLYGLTLLIALGVTYSLAFPRVGLFSPATVAPREAADFATSFFGVFAAVQFAVVALLTPALAAAALAEERGRHTLLFLLTTHLTNREIVLGKLVARAAYLFTYLLAGVPVLVLSAYDSWSAARENERVAFMRKPFKVGALVAKVHAMAGV